MTLVTALRQLWRRPILVIAALICACLIGVAVPYRIPSLQSRQHNVGVASASALVDSTKSQVADLGISTGSDVTTLAARASLLASLMTSSPIIDDIARRAGVPVDTIIGTPPATIGASASPAPAVPSASVSAADPRANLLRVSIPQFQSGQLPIITVNTQSPNAAQAARLADASFAALQDDVSSVAISDKVPDLQRLVVRQLGPAGSGLSSRGPAPMYGIIAALVVFALACGAILGSSALATAWRKAYAAERGLLTPGDSSSREPAGATAGATGVFEPAPFEPHSWGYEPPSSGQSTSEYEPVSE